MKKIAILCIFAVILGSTPIYAADSSNTNSVQQLQTQNPQLYQDLMDLKTQIEQNPNQIIDLLNNQDVQNQIHQWVQNPDVQSQIHQLLQNPVVQSDLNTLMQNKDIKNDLAKIVNGSS